MKPLPSPSLYTRTVIANARFQARDSAREAYLGRSPDLNASGDPHFGLYLRARLKARADPRSKGRAFREFS